MGGESKKRLLAEAKGRFACRTIIKRLPLFFSDFTKMPLFNFRFRSVPCAILGRLSHVPQLARGYDFRASLNFRALSFIV